MMLSTQFEEPQTPSAPILGASLSSSQFGVVGNERRQELAENRGVLGNERIQEITESREVYSKVWRLMSTVTTGVHTRSKLEFLKSQQFKAEGREQRIRASLAALDGPQPIILTTQEWRSIVEEIEDED